jgi:hypothetical protein
VPRTYKLARWIKMLGLQTRLDRIPLRLLQDRYWRVEVATVTHNSRQRRLSPENVYSKVLDIVERLA